jgi:hypothetical protein
MEDTDIITNVEGLPPLLNFPRPPKEYTILRKGKGKFVIEGDEAPAVFSLASEASDYIEKELGGNAIFSASQLEGETGSKKRSRGGMYFEDGTHRMLISHSFEDKLKLLRYSYANFLENTEYYRANSDDWVAAYHWLDTHPAFWHRNRSDDSHWSTQNGMAGRWESVNRNEDGKVSVGFEHGGTVFPAGTHHYHDTDLDTYSTSLEQAFVDYARKVDKHFNLDGTRKPVGYGYDDNGNKVDR